jgi:hypothetical protein
MSENSPRSAIMALDQLFKSLIGRAAASSPLICCVFNPDEPPAYAEAMLRDPAPPIGQLIDQSFAETVQQATLINPAVHDGAIMASLDHLACRIAGWSYRLFPPPVNLKAAPNRGSAFNSCLAMSLVDGVISIYLVSGALGWRFEKGQIQAL